MQVLIVANNGKKEKDQVSRKNSPFFLVPCIHLENGGWKDVTTWLWNYLILIGSKLGPIEFVYRIDTPQTRLGVWASVQLYKSRYWFLIVKLSS